MYSTLASVGRMATAIFTCISASSVSTGAGLVGGQENARADVIRKALQLGFQDFAFAAAQAFGVSDAAHFFQ